ncbi:DUF2946 family protein [Bordetella trematum]|uniref:DUF2946 family protein n=1 Tax=Bordetella trematum TaxID=123899 RepID=UPI00163B7B03|nr:DUF2946 family protein [Bordetella trematum]
MMATGRTGKGGIALIAALLFAFHSVVAASALGMLRVDGVTTIVCTASGPRVITLQADGSTAPLSKDSPHTGAMPHCCTAGSPLLDAGLLPVLLVLSWPLANPAPSYLPAHNPDPLIPAGWLDDAPGRPRGPPLA